MSTDELEAKVKRAKEIDERSRQIPPIEQKRIALLFAQATEEGLNKIDLSISDKEILTEQLEGMRLSIELDF